MRIITSFGDTSKLLSTGCVVTIGNFDGVHLGHQQLIRSVVEKAREMGLPAVVVTFAPHPESFFRPESSPPLLMTESSKLEVFSSLGIDIAIVLPFTSLLAGLSAQEFVQRVLVEGLRIKHIIVGHDYAFGKGRTGNAETLAEFGNLYKFTVDQLMPVFVKGAVVSSTRIRSIIQAGDVPLAATLLGRPHFLQGEVVSGKGRGGKALGFPTANIAFDKGLCLPTLGVYAAYVSFLDNTFQWLQYDQEKCISAVVSVGMNPTFGDVPLSVEAHLLDFDKDIYHSQLRVWFVGRLRDERKFDSLEALKAGIKNDIREAKQLFL